jgi:nucleotide sugar dehydrogenase
MQYDQVLRQKIKSRSAKVGILGMGYVGNYIARLTTGAGYQTIGFVRNKHRAKKIKKLGLKNLRAAIDIKKMRTCDICIVCVQTPIDKNKKPDLTYLSSAVRQVAGQLRKGQLIVVESSIAAGTTRNVLLPILTASGYKCGEDFFFGHSPERVDPGNDVFPLYSIPKIVAGADDISLMLLTYFYQTIVQSVVPVSSLEAAEVTKLFENSFRLLNISFVNQFSEYAQRRGLNVWEIIKAASTKPFGFLPHYPGPGVGGHCIPVDPYYLLDDARSQGVSLTLLEEAGEINDKRPQLVYEKALEILGKRKTKRKKILLIGVAYKPNIDDIRESAALKIWALFKKNGYKVSYYDPFVPKVHGVKSIEFTEKILSSFDLIIILTNHSNVQYDVLLQTKIPILDTRNTFQSRSYERVVQI